MKKLLSIAILALFANIASFALPAISGPTTGCTGTTFYYYDSSSAGFTWSSSNTAVATIDASGACTAISAGVTTISYTSGGATSTLTVTVYPTPAAITGPTSVCVGSTITLADATPGGTWSSSDISIGTVGLSTGVVTGVSSGMIEISYTTGGRCSSTLLLTVGSGGWIDSITGPTSVCVGSTITLSDLTPGGVWSSTNTAIATIGTSGVVTGVSAGTVDIDYTVTTTCGGSVGRGYTITVVTAATAGPISGPTTVVAGSDITLTDGVSGGTWSSSSTGVATIDATTGVLSGVSAGTTIITYMVSACSSTSIATYIVSVTPFDGISGDVVMSSYRYYGTVKVWLIHYNPSTHMLTAIDSSSISCAGATSVHYQFAGLASDSFRVKASAEDSVLFGSTGYIPTYHDTSYYWFDANVINHTSGTADINKDIHLAFGTVTSGSGFIAGDVTTGANRGSSTATPAVGLTVYLTNAAGKEIMSTITDAAGHYSFGTLAYGTYNVHPEAINYLTTNYSAITLSAITLSASYPNISAASFVQHTISKTITPTLVAVNNVNVKSNSLVAFPNPTCGKLNINWSVASNETATIVITDIAGREIYKSTADMNAGNGSYSIDLSNINNGLYIMSVKSASINYNNKIQVQH